MESYRRRALAKRVFFWHIFHSFFFIARAHAVTPSKAASSVRAASSGCACAKRREALAAAPRARGAALKTYNTS